MTDLTEKTHITKTEINALSMQRYEGGITLCKTPEEAERVVEKLLDETVLGFDTETRPTFRKGESHLPSLLQFAGERHVYLFQIQQCTLAPLLEILSRPDIVKAGVAIERDLAGLKRLTPFQEAGFIDISHPAKEAGIKNLGLRGLTALLFSFRISKKEQVSNWARQDLTESQKRYAATDAWASRNIYLWFKEKGGIR